MYPHSVPFDSQLVEAKLALNMIGPEEMPSLAWDALEAGLDGLFIRRLAALINPSGWETDQIESAFMAEAGLKRISIGEASIRIARQIAIRILSDGRDPLAHTRDFYLLWVRAEYAAEIQEIACLDDAKAWMTEADLRKEARDLLIALVAGSGRKLRADPDSGPSAA
jgi:hypothetical protein